MLRFVDISNRAFDILPARWVRIVVTSLVVHYENYQSTMQEILSEIYVNGIFIWVSGDPFRYRMQCPI